MVVEDETTVLNEVFLHGQLFLPVAQRVELTVLAEHALDVGQPLLDHLVVLTLQGGATRVRTLRLWTQAVFKHGIWVALGDLVCVRSDNFGLSGVDAVGVLVVQLRLSLQVFVSAVLGFLGVERLGGVSMAVSLLTVVGRAFVRRRTSFGVGFETESTFDGPSVACFGESRT